MSGGGRCGAGCRSVQLDAPSVSLANSPSSATAMARCVVEPGSFDTAARPNGACYVALAASLDPELLTTDARLGRAAHGLVTVVATS